MRFLSRKPSEGELQVPDQLAVDARNRYGRSDFGGALELYGRAIDKIHTMCVVAERTSRIRSLGPGDQTILDGFVSALGASLAQNGEAPVGDVVRHTLGYLDQIAREAAETTGFHSLYLDAADQVDQTYRLGTGRPIYPT